MDTVWEKLDECQLNDNGTSGMDGGFYPILASDRVSLERALRGAVEENMDEFDEDYTAQYYLERLEATHFYLSVSIPEGVEGVDYDDNTTWWDFGSTLAKQIDGEWYVWSEDPGDTGNIWYQSTYTKSQAYAVRDFHIEYAKRGELLAGDDYDGQSVYEACKVALMPFW
jgi:hypothetical protein